MIEDHLGEQGTAEILTFYKHTKYLHIPYIHLLNFKGERGGAA